MTQFPWLVICFWFCGKHGVAGHKYLRYPCRSDFGPWSATGRAVVQCSPDSLFMLLGALSLTHLSVNVRYGALLKLCK